MTKLIKDLKREGRRIHVYGASTKGNVILQFCGIDNSLIDYAADRNPDKNGARTIGTDIPIISEEESRKMRPDYYLVLPWHFRDEFLARAEDNGGRRQIHFSTAKYRSNRGINGSPRRISPTRSGKRSQPARLEAGP